MLVFTGVTHSSQFHFPARWLEKQNARNSHPFCTLWFPRSSQAVHSQAQSVEKVEPSGAPTVCGFSEKRSSGGFLSFWGSSHTFLVAWGDLSSARSSCYIPVVNARLLIMVIEETRQLCRDRPEWEIECPAILTACNWSSACVNCVHLVMRRWNEREVPWSKLFNVPLCVLVCFKGTLWAQKWVIENKVLKWFWRNLKLLAPPKLLLRWCGEKDLAWGLVTLQNYEFSLITIEKRCESWQNSCRNAASPLMRLLCCHVSSLSIT